MALNDFSSLEITVFSAILKLVNESNLFGKCSSIKQVEANIQPSRTSNSTLIFQLLGKAVEPVVNRRKSFSSVWKEKEKIVSISFFTSKDSHAFPLLQCKL